MLLLFTEAENMIIAEIINKIETASNFNEMGDWTMKLNEISMPDDKRRSLFYTIDFPFNAKAEFFDGAICIQEYPLEM